MGQEREEVLQNFFSVFSPGGLNESGDCADRRECGALGSRKSWRAWPRTGSTARSDVTAPAGAPGRFTISERPRVPATPRERTAKGVSRRPSARMRSGSPSSRRSQTRRVASGVTSRTVSPVPPVVRMSGKACAASRKACSIRSCSSGRIRRNGAEKPASASSAAAAGPERSSRSPLKQRSLMVRTAAVTNRLYRRPHRRSYMDAAGCVRVRSTPARPMAGRFFDNLKGAPKDTRRAQPSKAEVAANRYGTVRE